jgi:hypothetical protein
MIIRGGVRTRLVGDEGKAELEERERRVRPLV